MINNQQADALFKEIKQTELRTLAMRQAAERLLVATSHYTPRNHNNMGHYG